MQYLNVPLKICGVELKNRLVMPPMATKKANPQGLVTDEMCDYYSDKTKSGNIGLVITEHAFVTMEGKASPCQLSVSSDECIEGLACLADAIHKNGTKVFVQISHAGIKAYYPETGEKTYGPSALLYPGAKPEVPMPTAMTRQHIAETEEKFALAAARAKKAGVDGVEIHAAHGYFLNQFYSPITNVRTDEYGAASVENRVRIHTETLKMVRQAVGDDFPIAIRFGACDYMDGGSTIEDAITAATLFEKAGADIIDISGGTGGFMVPGRSQPGYFRDTSEMVKKAVNVPVILTGGVKTALQAEALLSEGCADLIGVGRAIFADSAWADTAFSEK